jgi:hypothetical protein
LPLLGWGPAVLCGVGPPVLLPLDADADADADADDDDWLELPVEALVAELVPLVPLAAAGVEPDDPPQAASSSTSDPSPLAAAHRLLPISHS